MKEMDRKFYEKTLRPDRQKSYDLIAEIITQNFSPSSVVDYGCGAGWVLYYLKRHGLVDVKGIEPNPAMREVAKTSVLSDIETLDLRVAIDLGRKFDLAVSLEVVEHVDKKYASMCVENITRHSDKVFFSAAPPGQGGYGHVNEQPFEYWEAIFRQFGFHLLEEDTERCRKFLKTHKAKAWYHRNLRILEKE